MEIGTNPDYDQAFAAALGWWREAGVDITFFDEPRRWLAPLLESSSDKQQSRERPKPAPPPASSYDKQQSRARPKPAPQIVVEPVATPPTLPDDLETFHSWWMTAPELDQGGVAGRVPPRGPASPELMILACAPENTDSDRLLSGPEGKLMDAFVSAAGLNTQAVYHASVLPCHSPGADWSAASTGLLADALVRHITLVRPKRLMVIGFIVLPLLGHDSPQAPAVSSSFNHEGVTVPMLALRRIPAAASQRRWKAALWQAWLDWSA